MKCRMQAKKHVVWGLIFFCFGVTAILYLVQQFPRKLYAAPTLAQMAAHWSPLIYQGTKNNYDFITNFNFDGNWNGRDNWENAGWEGYYNNFHAYVYYAIVESENHYFITYMLFHPRDQGNSCIIGYYFGSHENDSEAVRVVIEKDGTNWGRMGWIEATHHDSFCFTYFPTLINGSHPAVYVCEKKHAIYCTNKAEGWDCCYLPGPDCRIFPGNVGTGVAYWYAGRGAEVPSGTNDRDVSYELISMESTLWPKKSDSLTYRTCWAFVSGGYNWDEELQLCGHALSEFGAKFNGDNYSLGSSKCFASAPWAYAFEAAGWGKWFIDPLFYYGAWHCDGSGEQYIYNPYFGWIKNCPLNCN